MHLRPCSDDDQNQIEYEKDCYEQDKHNLTTEYKITTPYFLTKVDWGTFTFPYSKEGTLGPCRHGVRVVDLNMDYSKQH